MIKWLMIRILLASVSFAIAVMFFNEAIPRLFEDDRYLWIPGTYCVFLLRQEHAEDLAKDLATGHGNCYGHVRKVNNGGLTYYEVRQPIDKINLSWPKTISLARCESGSHCLISHSTADVWFAVFMMIGGAFILPLFYSRLYSIVFTKGKNKIVL